MRLGIVGSGRAAAALALAWKDAPRPLSGIHARTPESLPEILRGHVVDAERLATSSDLIALAVSDSAIADVWGALRPLVSETTAVFHLSGALTSTLLEPHPLRFSLHPLRALPDAGEAPDFARTLFTFEGTDDASAFAQEVIAAVGGTLRHIDPSAKLAYHAGAVFASNFVAVMLEQAERLLRESGVEEGPVLSGAISDLALSAVENWRTKSGERRFTGPVCRGDLELVTDELAALTVRSPLVADIYQRLSRLLALRLIELDPERADLQALTGDE